ncbi:hypothetical protein HDU76_002621 [Blyttiomyces sp. JEL0837]|nr:hypothetical protein HDU76_002621 [Blyttiomyces sp. JEL0837]
MLKSTWHLIVDFTIILSLMYLNPYFHTKTPTQESLFSWPIYLIYANIVGFFMWSLFVVGHDAGHGTYSNSFLVNSIAGHLAHGFLLVPFWPWAKSHGIHHAYHQHKDKDKSHVWFSVEEEGFDKFFKDWPFFIPFSYSIGYLFLGFNDGSHYFPWSKLYTTNKERVQCAFSAAVCYAFAGLFFYVWGFNGAMSVYFGPWLVYNTWLYAVTYLQHHCDTTEVFGKGTWSFVIGGLQTVDRVYDTQFGVMDGLMHNITDGHVVHHFFSTSIPHYNLIEATEVLRPQLGAGYKKVIGFPLLELLRDHWYSTRPYLVSRPPAEDKERWVMVDKEVAMKELEKIKKEQAVQKDQ